MKFVKEQLNASISLLLPSVFSNFFEKNPKTKLKKKKNVLERNRQQQYEYQ